MDEATTWTIIGIATAIISPFIYRKRHKQQEDEEQKLRIHFKDIKSKVIDRISEMARSLAIKHERLVYGSRAPVQDDYDFEHEDYYMSFETHFPELAKEWKNLNRHAIKADKELVSFFHLRDGGDKNIQYVANDHIKDLQQEFKDFNKRLVGKAEHIEKYGIGKEFKKVKNCPICKKF